MVAHDERCAACGGPLELWSEAQWKSLAAGAAPAEPTDEAASRKRDDPRRARHRPPARD